MPDFEANLEPVQQDSDQLSGVNKAPGRRLRIAPLDRPFVEAKNPYVVGRPVQGRQFVGRSDILKMIHGNLTAGAGKNILVLRGQRRTGKTSVLLRLHDTLPQESNGLYLPVFVDLQGMTMIENEGQFFHLLAHHTWSNLRSQQLDVHKPLARDYEQSPFVAFEFTFLESVKRALGDRQILLMLDEFEKLKDLIDRGRISARVLDYCRHLMQHSPLLFLIAGTQKLRELTGGYWSVFFNLTQVIDIGTLEKAEAYRLITEPVRSWYVVDPAAVQNMVQATGCHPYFTQLVCKHLVEVRNECRLNFLTLRHSGMAISRAIQSGDEQIGYPWTEEDCSPAERLVLAALVGAWRRGSPLQPAEALGESVHRLVNRGVLRGASEGNLSFVVPLFRRWLEERNFNSVEAAARYNSEHPVT